MDRLLALGDGVTDRSDGADLVRLERELRRPDGVLERGLDDGDDGDHRHG